MKTQLDILNKQLLIGTEINVLMTQSNNLLDIVNKNQKQVNDLKKQSDLLDMDKASISEKPLILTKDMEVPF